MNQENTVFWAIAFLAGAALFVFISVSITRWLLRINEIVKLLQQTVDSNKVVSDRIAILNQQLDLLLKIQLENKRLTIINKQSGAVSEVSPKKWCYEYYSIENLYDLVIVDVHK